MRSIQSKPLPLWRRVLHTLLAGVFALTFMVPPQFAQAQNAFSLPLPGTMVAPTPGFVPVILKGVVVHPENPFAMDFIIDTGNDEADDAHVKEETERLIRYFLASLTTPEDELWVNLSPYEEDRIIPESFGVTEMGRDLLGQDYLLKQLTASLIYPEDELGSKFWDRVYKKAYELYGTTQVPINTFNKVWILPEKAVIYQSGTTAVLVESRLKVMLEGDYLALMNNLNSEERGTDQLSTSQVEELSEATAQIVREILIPEIEKEINEGQNFATLRQIYHSQILAMWYKNRLKNALLNQIYSDQNKISGIDIDDKNAKDKIYEQYMAAFKTGVYNYIKEDYDKHLKTQLPRKYFSGGYAGDQVDDTTEVLELDGIQTSSPGVWRQRVDEAGSSFRGSMRMARANMNLSRPGSTPSELSTETKDLVFSNVDRDSEDLRVKDFETLLPQQRIYNLDFSRRDNLSSAFDAQTQRGLPLTRAWLAINQLLHNTQRVGGKNFTIEILYDQNSQVLRAVLRQESSENRDWEKLAKNWEGFQQDGVAYLADIERRKADNAAVYGGGAFDNMGELLKVARARLTYTRGEQAPFPITTVLDVSLKPSGELSGEQVDHLALGDFMVANRRPRLTPAQDYNYENVDRFVVGVEYGGRLSTDRERLLYTLRMNLGSTKRPLRILDIGTGLGRFPLELAEFLTENGFEVEAVIGIEQDRRASATHKQVMKEAKEKELPVDLRIGDARKFRSKEKFDIVMAVAPSDDEVVINQVRRLAAPGGMVWLRFDENEQEAQGQPGTYISQFREAFGAEDIDYVMFTQLDRILSGVGWEEISFQNSDWAAPKGNLYTIKLSDTFGELSGETGESPANRISEFSAENELLGAETRRLFGENRLLQTRTFSRTELDREGEKVVASWFAGSGRPMRVTAKPSKDIDGAIEVSNIEIRGRRHTLLDRDGRQVNPNRIVIRDDEELIFSDDGELLVLGETMYTQRRDTDGNAYLIEGIFDGREFEPSRSIRSNKGAIVIGAFPGSDERMSFLRQTDGPTQPVFMGENQSVTFDYTAPTVVRAGQRKTFYLRRDDDGRTILVDKADKEYSIPFTGYGITVDVFNNRRITVSTPDRGNAMITMPEVREWNRVTGSNVARLAELIKDVDADQEFHLRVLLKNGLVVGQDRNSNLRVSYDTRSQRLAFVGEESRFPRPVVYAVNILNQRQRERLEQQGNLSSESGDVLTILSQKMVQSAEDVTEQYSRILERDRFRAADVIDTFKYTRIHGDPRRASGTSALASVGFDPGDGFETSFNRIVEVLRSVKLRVLADEDWELPSGVSAFSAFQKTPDGPFIYLTKSLFEDLNKTSITNDGLTRLWGVLAHASARLAGYRDWQTKVYHKVLDPGFDADRYPIIELDPIADGSSGALSAEAPDPSNVGGIDSSEVNEVYDAVRFEEKYGDGGTSVNKLVSAIVSHPNPDAFVRSLREKSDRVRDPVQVDFNDEISRYTYGSFMLNYTEPETEEIIPIVVAPGGIEDQEQGKFVGDKMRSVVQKGYGKTRIVVVLGNSDDLQNLAKGKSTLSSGNEERSQFAWEIVTEQRVFDFTKTDSEGAAGSSSEFSSESRSPDVGGIDLNPVNLDLEIRGDDGAPLTIDPARLQGIQIEGLTPVIINITPVTSLPLLLSNASPKQPPTAIPGVAIGMPPADIGLLSAVRP